MDPFSQLGGLNPVAGFAGGSSSLGALPGLGGMAGSRASGCCQPTAACCQPGQGSDPTMLMLMQISMMQMLQILMMLMLGQKGEAGKGASDALGQLAGVNGGGTGAGTGGSSPAAGAAGATGGGVSNPSVNSEDQGEIKAFIREAAAAYGADPAVLTEMARRESSFDTDVQNNWDSNAKKGTPSRGLFQFIEPTFNSMAPKAKAANPQAWANLGPLNWNDWRQQALTAAWAITHGYGSHWATYKAAGGR